MSGLTKGEIIRLVNEYIGVSGGYLGDFSYRTHEEFYPIYCNMDIDLTPYRPGTTRDVFIRVLQNSAPQDQVKIIKGVFEKYPIEDFSDQQRPKKQKLYDMFSQIVRRLETTNSNSKPEVHIPALQLASNLVKKALNDADILTSSADASSAVDRVHTALHGYLRTACQNLELKPEEDLSITALFKLFRQNHPLLKDAGHRSQDVGNILRALSSIIDSLNPIRNHASIAHPNDQILEPEEAMLVINSCRTIMQYLDSKLISPSARTE